MADATISWTKATSITSGNKYLITASSSSVEYYLASSAPVSGVGTRGTLTSLSTDSETNTYTFTASGSGYTIAGDAGTLYSSGSGKYLNSTTSGTSFNRVWTVAYANGFFTLLDATKNTYLELYNATDWRTYTSVTQAVSSITLYQATTVADVFSTNITLGNGISSSMAVGTSQTVTATLTPTNTTEIVNWSIQGSDSNIAKVAVSSFSGGVSTAVLTALSNGSFTLVATASKTTSLTVSSSSIEITGGTSGINPITLTSSSFGFTSSAYPADADYTVGNAVYFLSKVTEATTDYQTKYEIGSLLMHSGDGIIKTETAFANSISSVLVSEVSTTTSSVTIKGGSSIGATTSTATSTISGHISTFSFSSPVKYIVINSTATVYANSFTIQFDGGLETTDSLAAYINGLIPNRADNTSSCIGSTGNYVVSKTRFLAAPSSVQSDFQTSTDSMVVSARTRYVTWCTKAGDSNPYSSTIVSQSISNIGNINEDNSSTYASLALLAVGIIAIGSFFLLRKKHLI
jgi:hypothetical protein